MEQSGPTISKYGLKNHGIINFRHARWNYPAPALYEQVIVRGEGMVANGGPLVMRTGLHTGRSVKDKFIVRDSVTEDSVDWGAVNQPIAPAFFERLRTRVQTYFQGRDLFIRDCFVGADPEFRVPVRIITEYAWHSLFAHNLFIQPGPDELARFEPRFTVIDAPHCHADPETDETASEVFITVNFAERLVLIGGTGYAGEIKKSVFSILNYLLPEKDVMPMHCSVNVGPDNDPAIFFGLSGTGKTTLSADPGRTLIGDDEHGWSDNGLFNFEGGCYAKAINLSAAAEPEIYAAARRFGTVLENVVIDPDSRVLDLDDGSLTENTRAAYPISFIPDVDDSGLAGQPRNLIMLTADAFGVMPPIARLSADQAMYHFLSGYTAKVAGTEKGLGNEPVATFSTCFGAPFMARHPSVYAKLLGRRIADENVTCWLVNTGWSGGAYGVGERMKIAHTRAILRAALGGELRTAPTAVDGNFGFSVPQTCPDVPAEVLNPRKTWADSQAYDDTAGKLVGLFRDNFVKYETSVGPAVIATAPQTA